MRGPDGRAIVSPESRTSGNSRSAAEQRLSDAGGGLIRSGRLAGLRLLRLASTLIGRRLIVGFVRARFGLVLGHGTSCGLGAVIAAGHDFAMKSLMHLN